jgi:hypothetical protein
MTTYINPGNNTGLYGINDININTPYGNANVETFLATGSDTGGNVVGNIVSSGNVTANYYFGDGSQLTGIAGTYGNAEVSAYLSSGTNTANIVTTANIAGAYVLGNGSQLTGLPATYSNAQVATFLANYGSNTIVTTGNITGGNFIGSGAALTSLTGANVTGTVANATYAVSAGSATTATTATSATTAGTVTTAAQPNITSVGTLTSLSSSGNIQGNYFIGNGSLLTGLASTYGNAEVAAFLPTYTGNLAGGNITVSGAVSGATVSGNGAGLSALTGANVTGTVANATYAVSAGSATTATSATTAGTVTTNAQPNITSVGTLTTVSSTGNITGANINGNGSGLSALTGANVTGTVANATYAVSAGSATTAVTVTANAQPNITSVGTLTSLSVTGNIVGGNIATAGTFAVASISASGNVTGSNVVATTLLTGPQLITTGLSGNISGVNYIFANNFQGNGSLLTSLTGANVTGTVANATYATSAGSATTATSATTAGTVTSNAQPNITSVGTLSSLSSSGNITASYFLGNGSALTGIVSTTTPGGSNTQLQYNDAGVMAGNSLMTFNNTTGNIALANVSIKGIQIENTTAYAVPSTSNNPGRLVIGNGYDGDLSVNYDPVSRLRNAHTAIWNKNNQGNASGQSTGLTVFQHTALTESVTNNQSRMFGMSSLLQIGGGTGANAFTQTSPLAIQGQGSGILVGNVGNALLGNTSVTAATSTSTGVQVFTGSTVANAIGFLSNHGLNGGALTTAIGFTNFPTTSGGTVGESIAFYNPSSSTVYNLSTPAVFRQATNGYWFLKNDDDVAINKMGSLKQYHEFNYTGSSTSGSVTIDKTNGQVQQITPTGNITVSGYSNFVSSASNGAATIEQADTVTLIIAQGSTPYTVTMPTGSTYKYSGNISTVGATANAVTMISVSAVRISGTTTYLTTISPEFV